MMRQKKQGKPRPANHSRPGRKLWSTGKGGLTVIRNGTVEPREPGRPPLAVVPKGDYFDPPRSIVDSRPPVAPEPLSRAAEQLLAEMLKRRAFSDAIEDGASVEWAAKTFFNVAKSRAHAIARQMPDGPLGWFRRKALDGMAEGTIGRGRATQKSSTADCFFTILAGGKDGMKHLRASFGCRRKADLTEIRRGHTEIAAECLDYLVHGNLLWSNHDG